MQENEIIKVKDLVKSFGLTSKSNHDGIVASLQCFFCDTCMNQCSNGCSGQSCSTCSSNCSQGCTGSACSNGCTSAICSAGCAAVCGIKGTINIPIEG